MHHVCSLSQLSNEWCITTYSHSGTRSCYDKHSSGVRRERVFWWGQEGGVGFSTELPGVSDFAVAVTR